MTTHPSKQKPPKNASLVSIIIPTFNSEKTLENCLKSIRNQSYKDIELIVVDAFSQDKTREIAEKYSAKVFLLAAERSPARNFGAEQAMGEFLCFVDSDMELPSKTIGECAKLCKQKNVDAVIIPEEAVGDNFLAKCRKLEKTMRRQEAYGEAPRFIRKEKFESVGGYSENLVIGEDFELTQRLRNFGSVIGRCKATIKHHEGNVSIKKLVMKLYYYGKTLPAYIKKEPVLALKTSSPIRFIKNLHLLKRQPLYFVGLCGLKLFEYAAYLTGAFAAVFFSNKTGTRR
ncbi:MAG: glycosyltransferase [Candidatus Bathyarchaeia archaeon]